MFLKNKKKTHGFTLIELLIVIAVMAILAAVVFVTLDPIARFEDARNNTRWTDVNAILSAFKLYQVDNNGIYTDLWEVGEFAVDTYYHVSNAEESGCGETDYSCANLPDVMWDACLNLYPFITGGYLPDVPIDPRADTTEDFFTGYYLHVSSAGIITVGSCHEEQGSGSAAPEIQVAR